jgi:hypothetical protein
MESIVTKTCSECQKIKPIKEFGKHKKSPDGYGYKCQTCKHQYYQTWSIKNPNYHKNRYTTDPSKYRNLSSQNRQKNPTYIKHYFAKRCQIDVDFKMLFNLRSRFTHALKNNPKVGHTIDLLMCTVIEWRKHLESLWTDGMSWDNYGNKAEQWSVDHIIPCSFFNLNDPVEQYMCFQWQNTRPIWHIDNLKKHNKLPKLIK